MPICAFRILPSGKTEPFEIGQPIPAEGYAWVHFDRADPSLPEFLTAHVPDIPAQSLTQAETRPRCDRYEDGLILNLRGINLNAGQSSHDMVSLRIWATGALIVSVRVRRVFAAEDLAELCRSQNAPRSVGKFLTALVGRLGDRIESEVTALGVQTDELEDDGYGADSSTGLHLGPKRKEVIKLRRYLAPQREALGRMLALDGSLFSKSELTGLREPVNRAILAVEELDAIKDRLDALQSHHDAQVAAKLGKNSYVLSIVAAIFLPLGLIAGLMGINVGGIPGADNPRAFWIVAAGLVVVGLVLVWIFHRIGMLRR